MKSFRAIKWKTAFEAIASPFFQITFRVGKRAFEEMSFSKKKKKKREKKESIILLMSKMSSKISDDYYY